MKTAIFGGTFNPPHLGHEMMIEYLSNLKEIEKIVLVPTGDPVHKLSNPTPKEHRLNMCKILKQKYNKIEISSEELFRKEPSFTYYTLKSFAESNGTTPVFVMGGDMLVTFTTWFRYKDLLKLCEIYVFRRKGDNEEEFNKSVQKIKQDGGNIKVLKAEILNISSTQARNNAGEFVSKEIKEYIEKNGLYKESDNLKIEEYKEHIKKMLSEKRYFHSLCVAEEAVRLVNRYGGNKEQAYLAGLLHDVLKDTPPNEQLKYANDFGIILTDLELGAKKLYHSLIGAEYVKNVLKVEDTEIINAIRCHTTAKANMTHLEKILYLADYTSRDRDYSGVEEMRQAVEESMEKAMKISLQFTIDDLKSKGFPCHPNTIEAYKQYVGE